MKGVVAPQEVFDQMLEHMVIPTFDLVIDVPDRGVLIARRKIAPYAGKWALPGLRMLKGESIDDTLGRIAEQETGLIVDLDSKRLLGQYVGKFRTEHNRQDLSTGYAVQALTNEVRLNEDHFAKQHRFIWAPEHIPGAARDTGAMYRYYISTYFDSQS